MSERKITPTKMEAVIEREFPDSNSADIIFAVLACANNHCSRIGINFLDVLETVQVILEKDKNDTNNNSHSNISGDIGDRINP